MPSARQHRVRRPAKARAEVVRALLECQGWRLATVAGRPYTLDDDVQHDDGHFLVHDKTNEDGRPTDTVVLICLTKEYLFDLHSMSQQLQHAGYTSTESEFADALDVRAATSEETEQRTTEHARNVGPLLAALLPNSSKRPPVPPSASGPTLF